MCGRNDNYCSTQCEKPEEIAELKKEVKKLKAVFKACAKDIALALKLTEEIENG